MTQETENRLIDNTYVLEECLGAGAMGAVYRARHILLQKAFALKLIKRTVLSTEEGLRRFEIEARALGQLTHTNIVRVTDYGIDPAGKTPYLVMELIDGKPLNELIKNYQSIPLSEALTILKGIAEGLDYAHAQGILHRDLKPHNIIVAEESGRRIVKIVDFGLARFLAGSPVEQIETSASWDRPMPLSSESGETIPLAAQLSQNLETKRIPDQFVISQTEGTSQTQAPTIPETRTAAGALIGTAAYMAPEVADQRSATTSSDIYSFGVLAYELLVGKRPFTGSYASVLRAHLFDDIPDPHEVNPDLPREMDKPIYAALEKEPQSRPKTACAVVKGFQSASIDNARHRWRRQELPRRAILAGALCLLTLAFAHVLKSWPIVIDLENRLIDSRFEYADPLPPSPQLALAILDDATLDSDPANRPITDYADEFGIVLARAFDAGVIGVGLDIEVPAFWQHSDPFLEFIVNHSDHIAMALHSDEHEKLIGSEIAEGAVTLILGHERSTRLFGYANFMQDRDSYVRHFALGFEDLKGAWHPTLANRIVSITNNEAPQRGDTLLVDYRIDWHQIPKFSWKDLPRVIDDQPDLLAGRFLLVGGDIAGFGDENYPVPKIRGRNSLHESTAPGVMIQALIVNTLLDPSEIVVVDWTYWSVLAFALMPALMALLWWPRLAIGLSVMILLSLTSVALGYFVFVRSLFLVPMAPVLILLPVVTVITLVIRSKLPRRP